MVDQEKQEDKTTDKQVEQTKTSPDSTENDTKTSLDDLKGQVAEAYIDLIDKTK